MMRALAVAFGMITAFNISMGTIVLIELINWRRYRSDAMLHRAKAGIAMDNPMYGIEGYDKSWDVMAVPIHQRHLRRVK